MGRRVWFALATLALTGGLAVAQDTAESTRGTAPDGQHPFRSVIDRVREATRLPRTAAESREAGVEEGRLREILRTAREGAVPAGEMREILVLENEKIRAGGDPGNFGAAVQEMKARGLRGRALAEAIHAEQAARGMKRQYFQDGQGRPQTKGKGKAPATKGKNR